MGNLGCHTRVRMQGMCWNLMISLLRMVFHQGGLSSGWSFIVWSLIMMVFHQGGLIRVVFHCLVSHHDGLSSGRSVIRVVSQQGDVWSLIRVVSQQGDVWSFIRVVSHYGGVLSG